MRPVTVTEQDEMQAVITAGLTPSERVITTGFNRLSDGAKVAVTAAEEPGAAPVAGEQPRRARGNNSGQISGPESTRRRQRAEPQPRPLP
jgi:multidrug efflux system membrane fusion protein